jgi:hypothetical protein
MKMDTTTAAKADDTKVAHDHDVESAAPYDDPSSLGKGDILQQEHTDPVLNAKMHLVNNAMFALHSYPLPPRALTMPKRRDWLDAIPLETLHPQRLRLRRRLAHPADSIHHRGACGARVLTGLSQWVDDCGVRGHVGGCAVLGHDGGYHGAQDRLQCQSAGEQRVCDCCGRGAELGSPWIIRVFECVWRRRQSGAGHGRVFGVFAEFAAVVSSAILPSGGLLGGIRDLWGIAWRTDSEM